MQKNTEKELQDRAKITAQIEKAIQATQKDIAKNQELIEKLKSSPKSK